MWILLAGVITLLPTAAMAADGPMTDSSPCPTTTELVSPAFAGRVAPLLRAEHIKDEDADAALGAAGAYCMNKHSPTFRAALHGAVHDPDYFSPLASEPAKKKDPRSDMLMFSNKPLAQAVWFAEAASTCGLRPIQWAHVVILTIRHQAHVIADRLYPKHDPQHDSYDESTLYSDAYERATDAQDAMEDKGTHATPADCKSVLGNSGMFAILDKLGNAK